MAFNLFASRLGFRHFFHGHPVIGSHNLQQLFPYFARSSRSDLLLWPTKIAPTLKTAFKLTTRNLNKTKPFSLSISKNIALAGLGISLATWSKPAIRCDGMFLIRI